MKLKNFLNEEYSKEMYNDIKACAKEIGDFFTGYASVQDSKFIKWDLEKASAKSTVFKMFRTDDFESLYGGSRLLCIMIHKTGGCSAHICKWNYKSKLLHSEFSTEFGNCSGKIEKCWFTIVSAREIDAFSEKSAIRRKNKYDVDPLLIKHNQLKRAIEKSNRESPLVKKIKKICSNCGINILDENEFKIRVYDNYIDPFEFNSARSKSVEFTIKLYLGKQYIYISNPHGSKEILEKDYNSNIKVHFREGFDFEWDIDKVIEYADKVKAFSEVAKLLQSSKYIDLFEK